MHRPQVALSSTRARRYVGGLTHNNDGSAGLCDHNSADVALKADAAATTLEQLSERRQLIGQLIDTEKLLAGNERLLAENESLRTGPIAGPNKDSVAHDAALAENQRLQAEISRVHTENLKLTRQHTAVRAENSRLHANISSRESREERAHAGVVSKLESDNVLLQRRVELHKEEVRLQKEANLMILDNGAWANRWSWMERSVDAKVALAMEEQLVLTMIKLDGLSHSIHNRMQRKLLPFLFRVCLGFSPTKRSN